MTSERRQRLRLLLRDAAAACAFGSIAVSGSLPLLLHAVFVGSLLLGLANRRVLARRAGWTVGVLTVSAVVLFGLALRGTLDLVIAACSFAALVTAQRLLADPTPRTDAQVHLTSVLMVAGGAALSGELFFSIFVTGFFVLACLSLGLVVFDDLQLPAESFPVRPLMVRLGWGATLALAGGLLFFVLFPRLSWNLAVRRANPGLGPAVTGMADRVRLSGSGTLKSNPRPVARIKLRPDPQTATLDEYWFGRAFDTFSGVDWVGSGKAKAPTGAVTLAPSARDLVYQQIELLASYDARTALALDPPVLIGNATAHSPGGSQRISLVEVSGEEVRLASPAVSYSYHAYSYPGPPAPGGTADEPPLLQLPEGLDPRIGALARQVAGNETEPLKAARALASYLANEYRYTLELSEPSGDPLTAFLFERREGHCEHFATALAVMLRTLGFSARVVGGFYGGERVGDHYVLRAGDAHAWTQVFVPARGFVSVDATPSIGRRANPVPLLAWLTTLYERVDAQWRTRVLDYSFQDQVSLARALVRPPRTTEHGSPWNRRWWLALAVASLLTYAVWRVRRLLGRGQKRPRTHPAASFGRQIEQVLSSGGVRLLPDETLEDVRLRLTSTHHPGATSCEAVVRRYLEARFGGELVSTTERARLLGALELSLRRG